MTSEIWNETFVHTIERGNTVSYGLDHQSMDVWGEHTTFLKELGMNKNNTIIKKIKINETGGADYTIKFKGITYGI